MGGCLLLADQKRAYVLADRGTWLAFRARLGLKVLVEGDPRLRNRYGVIAVDPGRNPGVASAAARELVDYLTSADGQRRIGAFKLEGQQLFQPALQP